MKIIKDFRFFIDLLYFEFIFYILWTHVVLIIWSLQGVHEGPVRAVEVQETRLDSIEIVFIYQNRKKYCDKFPKVGHSFQR